MSVEQNSLTWASVVSVAHGVDCAMCHPLLREAQIKASSDDFPLPRAPERPKRTLEPGECSW